MEVQSCSLPPSRLPRVAVVGSGAIGLTLFGKLVSLYRASPQSFFSSLTLVCRTEENARWITSRGGIALYHASKTETPATCASGDLEWCALQPPAVNVVDQQRFAETPVDLALVCVKSHQVESVAPLLRRMFERHREAGVVVPLCNGIGHVARLATALPADVAVLPAVTYLAAERIERHTVKIHGAGATYVLVRGSSHASMETRPKQAINAFSREACNAANTADQTERLRTLPASEGVGATRLPAPAPNASSSPALPVVTGQAALAYPVGTMLRPETLRATRRFQDDMRSEPWGPALHLSAAQCRLLDEDRGLCAWLNAARLGPALVTDDERPFVEKLAVNCGVNAVATLLGVRNGELLHLPDAWQVTESAAMEVATLFGLPHASIGPRLRQIVEATSGNVNSMLSDVLAGRVTEVDALNGAVARLSISRTNRPSVVNATLAALVRALSQRQHQAECCIATPQQTHPPDTIHR